MTTDAQNTDRKEIFRTLSQKEALFTVSLGLERMETLRWGKRTVHNRAEAGAGGHRVCGNQNTREQEALKFKILP